MRSVRSRPHAGTPKRATFVTRFAWLLVAACVAGSAAGNARADDYTAAPWLVYRDANPFVTASGLPFAPPAAAPASWRMETLLAASNSELAFDRGDEHLLYDAEIHEVRIALTRAFGERWLLRATLGGESIGNGFLDSLLERWHRTFGLDNGDRGRLGSDGHVIGYADGRGGDVRLDRELHAFAPLSIDLAARFPVAGHEWLYGATLKLPTSHASALLDDRATDLSLWLAVQSTDARTRWPWGLRIGAMQRGSTRLLAERAADVVPFADATFAYRLRPQWDVAAQLQWHRALYDSAVPFLQSAATLALSTAWHARGGWSVRAGLVEDAIPRHAQDVTLFLGLSI
jgi:hypothetical protein